MSRKSSKTTKIYLKEEPLVDDYGLPLPESPFKTPLQNFKDTNPLDTTVPMPQTMPSYRIDNEYVVNVMEILRNIAVLNWRLEVITKVKNGIMCESLIVTINNEAIEIDEIDGKSETASTKFLNDILAKSLKVHLLNFPLYKSPDWCGPHLDAYFLANATCYAMEHHLNMPETTFDFRSYSYKVVATFTDYIRVKGAVVPKTHTLDIVVPIAQSI
jgi:hypothetical protein